MLITALYLIASNQVCAHLCWGLKHWRASFHTHSPNYPLWRTVCVDRAFNTVFRPWKDKRRNWGSSGARRSQLTTHTLAELLFTSGATEAHFSDLRGQMGTVHLTSTTSPSSNCPFCCLTEQFFHHDWRQLKRLKSAAPPVAGHSRSTKGNRQVRRHGDTGFSPSDSRMVIEEMDVSEKVPFSRLSVNMFGTSGCVQLVSPQRTKKFSLSM